jgi:D-aminoacyl-tRNA deacylase
MTSCLTFRTNFRRTIFSIATKQKSQHKTPQVTKFAFNFYLQTMIAVIQRTKEASVTIDGKIKGSIANGLLVLLGVTHQDTIEDATWLATKIVNLRIFGDSDGKMNLSILDTGGNMLIISQFTLYASTQKGNRPSFVEAAKPEVAIPLYEKFIALVETLLSKKVETGEFGAAMQVNLLNDGPVTIVIDTKNKK